jgi:tetratricopeptide (TPR) repeat protein
LRQASGSPEEAVSSLAAVKPDDPNYLAAQYELCQIRYQLWSRAKADAARAAALSGDVVKAVDHFLAVAGKQGDYERRLKAVLLAVEVLLAGPSADISRVAAYLNAATIPAEQVGVGSASAAEYHYRRMQLAQRTRDDETQVAAARWLVANAPGSIYELPALVVAARQADQAVESSPASYRRQKIDEARQIYARLTELLGESTAALANTKNALAASSRLAQYDEELGRWDEAAQRLARIAEAQPNDKRYLRRAGLAHVQAGKPAAALEYWRTLLGGLDSGSDDWLEAKYYQLICLQKVDPVAADKVWRQFKLLFPEVKSPVWGEQFAALERQFSA